MFLDDKSKQQLTEFAKYVRKKLGIKNPPSIVILKERGGLKTTANYDYTKQNKIIKVRGGDRHLVDIMRSLAHEMIHHKQWEDGKLKVPPPDIGGEIENEANSKAGEFIKLYAKIDSTIYESLSGEDKGNVL